jgi:hypothetical protein
LIESKTIDWATTKDWTNQHIQLSQHEWDNLKIRKIAYQSTIFTRADMPSQQQQVLDPIEAANTLQRLHPTADPFASLPKNYYHTVTNAFATNIIVGDGKSPGMESIFALQPPNWLHDVIITWWLGCWCEKTGGFSNS